MLEPLSPRQRLARGVVGLLTVFLIGFVLSVVVYSHLAHAIAQNGLRGEYAAQLEEGTAPVSEGTFDDVLLRDGAPVGIIEIPALGVSEVIVEGTGAGELKLGPGHRRSTVLPGQEGVSVLMGRAAAYGGPFGGIQQLSPGEKLTVTTGEGEHVYEVIGVRYAGDPAPPAVQPGEGRLVLTTARGAPYFPQGIARVDARLITEAQPAGPRQTTALSLPPEHQELAGDARHLWQTLFTVQLLVASLVAAAWSLSRFGRRRTVIVFTPVLLLVALLVADQVTLLLPNLL
ncbi:sortase [Microbacterium album]|uniref:sortase n=1 Tax=Microbacterium album TaxID=2053191 RepID=UPI001E51737A|nr:class E sortase [Microbacterium album]